MELDPVAGEVYWSSTPNNKIKKVSYIGAGPFAAEDVLTQAGGAPQALGLVIN